MPGNCQLQVGKRSGTLYLMLKPVRRIHFMGICGTAMGAVAAAIRDLGYVVSGSDDNVYPPMSTFLAAKEISIASVECAGRRRFGRDRQCHLSRESGA